jgi:Arc/MetJ-type ribon-helix-helix transcriptional regulator
VKVSVSLPDDDVDFLDRYADEHGEGSRSAALQRAIRLLRASELQDAYQGAWAEWAGSGDAEAWDAVADDGLDTE